MNLILLSSSDFVLDSSRVVLTGRRHSHVLDILKPKAGDVLTVGVEGGKIGTGNVLKITDKILELEVGLFKDPPSKLPVILCVALMRPIVLKRVLQTVTALGVGEIHLFHSRQVEKSFWQSTSLKSDAIRDELILGLEQAKDTVLPNIYLHKRFKPFVEDVVPTLLQGRSGVVADPSGEDLEGRGKREEGSGKREEESGKREEESGKREEAEGKKETQKDFNSKDSIFSHNNLFSSHLLPFTASLSSSFLSPLTVLFVGPEGGFIPYEVEKFREAGCRVVGLGARILKVETAIVTLLAKLF